MATKTTKKSTTKKPAAKKAVVRQAPAPRPKTARECINESDVLRFHMNVITVLSVLVCVLVIVLVYSVTR